MQVSVPGLSFMPADSVLNLWIRNDSFTSRSWCDLKPDSSIVAIMLLNEWPASVACLEIGKLGRACTWALWLLKRYRKAVSVWPLYCTWQIEHSSKYTTFAVLEVKLPLILNLKFVAVLAASDVVVMCAYTLQRGFLQGWQPSVWTLLLCLVLEEVNKSRKFLPRLYTTRSGLETLLQGVRSA